MAEPARWWEIRPAQSRQPKTYTCPICHGLFLAMVPNVLLSPEGDRERRRHAHPECVARERRAGRLLTRSEWERLNRPPREERPWWRRVFGR
ncbi:hypothetical protein P5P86_16970 [Nocardioides sp. BP30]|uniref:hypothetical protein n=1 Tax=Nocardioides sp. BP30 TaxID=3036374 RepID=UPI002468709B|nr:hypothetical protein [Nocardioides sp. BP30]WGL51640.1 hypothetical protein P5P86_16970 [Nocardioides sp. BP30]